MLCQKGMINMIMPLCNRIFFALLGDIFHQSEKCCPALKLFCCLTPLFCCLPPLFHCQPLWTSVKKQQNATNTWVEISKSKKKDEFFSRMNL